MKNVLHVIPSMDSRHGGTVQVLRSLIPALVKYSLQNEVLCFDLPGMDYGQRDDFLIHQIGPAKPLYAYCPGLSDWLKTNLSKYDAIVLHGLWLYHTFGVYQYWRRCLGYYDIKLYVMPHGMLDPYFQRAPHRFFKALRNSVFWHIIEKKTLNGANGLLFTCQAELERARTTFFDYHPKKEINIGFGIDKPPVFSQELKAVFTDDFFILNDGRPYLLFLSRLHHKKGVDILIKAYRKWKVNHQGLIPRLVIAGPGLNTFFGRKLLQLAKRDPDIVFTGMVQGLQKWTLLFHCDAFILPSHQENFGVAIIEAMACRKAVLISKKINIWREIKDGGGAVINTDSEWGVNSMISDWYAMTIEEQKIKAQRAYQTYIDRFTNVEAAKKFAHSLFV